MFGEQEFEMSELVPGHFWLVMCVQLKFPSTTVLLGLSTLFFLYALYVFLASVFYHFSIIDHSLKQSEIQLFFSNSFLTHYYY